MTTYLLGVIACLGLLAGCGGLQGSFQPVDSYGSGAPAEREELVGEEVSTKHLEELYAKSGLSGRDPSLEAELKQWEHQVKFDVPIQMNRQVKAYLVYFSTERKAIVQRQLARSTQYLPMIKTIFQEYGLPEDLAYLAMVESGFNPNAQSPAGACGMWQFIKGTGLRYGLVINGYVDERRDPEKSTRAAAKYLQDLYRQFGSWYLAAASYNCGERRVQQELNRSNHQNFWELSANRCLPGEDIIIPQANDVKGVIPGTIDWTPDQPSPKIGVVSNFFRKLNGPFTTMPPGITKMPDPMPGQLFLDPSLRPFQFFDHDPVHFIRSREASLIAVAVSKISHDFKKFTAGVHS